MKNDFLLSIPCDRNKNTLLPSPSLKKIGVPDSLVADGHRAQKSNEVKRFCDQVGTTLKILETGTRWENCAELYIGLLKEAVHKYLQASNAPMVIWDYSIQCRDSIHNSVPLPLLQSDRKTPYVSTFGVQGDISNLCTFERYKWVYYSDGGSLPKNKENIGRVLVPIKNEGNKMAQSVLNAKASVIPRPTIRKLRKDEIFSDTKKQKCRLFEDLIQKRLGDSMAQPEKHIPTEYEPYYDDSEPFSYNSVAENKSPRQTVV